MVARDISDWIREYAANSSKTHLVVGVSGGIDSSVVSTLCAETQLETIAISMPIHQDPNLHSLSLDHGTWLSKKYKNVRHQVIDLTSVYESFASLFGESASKLSLANSKSRMRMVALYQVASNCNGLVVGTGNKVEDFGIGFFTKYGDGGVDISPIADLLKTEVWNIGRELGVLQSIIDAPPTDGLWDDGRTDEQQIGATYAQLEWAMNNLSHPNPDKEQKRWIEIYLRHHSSNKHKMIPIPVYRVKKL